MIIDTHCHLADSKLVNDLDLIIKKAKDASVAKIISIGCSINEIYLSKTISDRYNDIYYTCGIYPHDNECQPYKDLATKERLVKLSEIAKNVKCVAIGECGFDLSVPPPSETARSIYDQEELFRAQIAISKDLKKPLIIHSRKAASKTVEVLTSEYKTRQVNIPGVWHCFSEDLDTLKIILNMGFCISIGGLITYQRSLNLQKVIEYCPIDKIILETDAPYLVPQKIKNKGITVNEPAYILEVLEKIAEIKNLRIEYCEDIILKSSLQVFNLN